MEHSGKGEVNFLEFRWHSQNELDTASFVLPPTPTLAVLTLAHPLALSGPSNFLHLLTAFPALDLGSVPLIPAAPLPSGTVLPWTDTGEALPAPAI